MVWPPPSTVVMPAGTVSDVVTSPQSAVNVNVVPFVVPAHTHGDVSPGIGSGVSHPASRGEEPGTAVRSSSSPPRRDPPEIADIPIRRPVTARSLDRGSHRAAHSSHFRSSTVVARSRPECRPLRRTEPFPPGSARRTTLPSERIPGPLAKKSPVSDDASAGCAGAATASRTTNRSAESWVTALSGHSGCHVTQAPGGRGAPTMSCGASARHRRDPAARQRRAGRLMAMLEENAEALERVTGRVTDARTTSRRASTAPRL